MPPLPVGRQQYGEPQLGAVYKGKVTGIMEFGCFVELQDFTHLGKKVRRRRACNLLSIWMFV